jgi:co-chaperonin GroES (HSP10)
MCWLVRRIEAEEKTGWRHHHPRHRQGKAAGRRIVSVGEGAYNEDGEVIKPT